MASPFSSHHGWPGLIAHGAEVFRVYPFDGRNSQMVSKEVESGLDHNEKIQTIAAG
jgi:hypothetical protein